jgi:hypothetical protein
MRYFRTSAGAGYAFFGELPNNCSAATLSTGEQFDRFLKDASEKGLTSYLWIIFRGAPGASPSIRNHKRAIGCWPKLQGRVRRSADFVDGSGQATYFDIADISHAHPLVVSEALRDMRKFACGRGLFFLPSECEPESLFDRVQRLTAVWRASDNAEFPEGSAEKQFLEFYESVCLSAGLSLVRCEDCDMREQFLVHGRSEILDAMNLRPERMTSDVDEAGEQRSYSMRHWGCAA